MVDIDSLKHVLTGGGAFLLLFSVLGQVCYSGLCASNDWLDSYYVNHPGRYGAYYQLSLGITVLGVFALVCILVYLVFTILELSFLPDIVLKIIGLVGVVFWFGMFIAECCAIDWSGPSSITPTRKAIANDKTVKYIIEHMKEVQSVYPLNYNGENYQGLLQVTLYGKNINFDKYEDYDEYKEVELGPLRNSLPTPCVMSSINNQVLCIGSWNLKKMDKFVDKANDKYLEDEQRFNNTEIQRNLHKITKKKADDSYYPSYKNRNFYFNSYYSPDSFRYGMIYAENTSIFLGGQIVGILLFVGSIALGFIGGLAGSPNKSDDA